MPNRVLNGFRFVAIQVGESLQQLAARVLGDASRWPDIVAINQLQPPYIVAPGMSGPGLKAYGDLLIVPAAKPVVTADVDPNAVFGVDLDMTSGLLHATASGDLALIGGRANLRQALSNRLGTRPADLLFHQDYGNKVYELLGQGGDATTPVLAAGYVRGACLADKRVASVSRTTATLSGDVQTVAAQIQPVTGAPLDVSGEVSL